MAKDVTHYLSWAAEPEHDERKLVRIFNFIINIFMLKILASMLSNHLFIFEILKTKR